MNRREVFKVSVITPTYNSAKSISKTINSVLNQSLKEWELIVVDDGSEDNTESIVSNINDERVHFFKRPFARKKGANACRNIGIENARGEWILFLDSDDELPPNFLEERIDSLQSSFDCVIFPQKHWKLFEGKLAARNRELKGKLLNSFLKFQFVFRITDTCWNKVYIKKLKFDEDLQRFQDVDLHIRMLSDKKSRLKIVKDKIDFVRNKDSEKYEDIVFLETVISSYQHLNRKFFEKNIFSKVELGLSSYFFLKKIVALRNLNKDYFSEKNINQILKNINYTFLKKYLFKKSLSVMINNPIIENTALNKVLFKLNHLPF